jgi:Domain of unknown function (DUF4398)
MTLRFSLLTVAFLLGTACASSNPPQNVKAENSSAAIRAAEETGAQHSPQAALHLQLAKEEFEHARTLTDHKDKDWADRLLLRAQVDAELSLALARSETEKSEAQGAIGRVKSLKESATQ